jgi:hypothetical protein
MFADGDKVFDISREAIYAKITFNNGSVKSQILTGLDLTLSVQLATSKLYPNFEFLVRSLVRSFDCLIRMIGATLSVKTRGSWKLDGGRVYCST